jgi:nucleoid-associated protein EbfC
MEFGKGLGGFTEIFQQAGRLREEVKRIQEGMATKTVEGTAGGGMVKVTANGRQEILSVDIDPEAMKLNDREMLQDLVRAAVNQALKASQELMTDEMKKLTGGFGLGSLASLFKGMV